MRPSIAIGIPTINQWPLLKSFLPLYENDYPGTKMFIIDNGQQNFLTSKKSVEVIYREEKNIGVAASWNKLCRVIFARGHTHAIISNDDVYWKFRGGSQGIIDFIEQNPRDFYKTQMDNWCLFIISKRTFELVGPFNEAFFPAYFEDRDYMRRMKLRGLSIMASMRFDPMIYNESLSTRKDNSLLDNFDKNEQLYIEMWGGKPGQEKYSTPFNRKTKK